MKKSSGKGGDVSPGHDEFVPKLEPRDQRHLESLQRKFQLVRDYVGAVATGRATGAYVHGPGGCGKSYTIITELDRLEVPYRLFNSRMTGRGLYNSLEEAPDEIHLLEDMEQLFRDSGARGVLRSALWGSPRKGKPGPVERPVTWCTYKMTHEFVFTGGIVMTANRPFPELPELEAIKTRIAYTQLTATDLEMTALMRHVAAKGYVHGVDEMSPEECGEVCEHIIRECRGLNRAIDMRMLINGFADYIQWRECLSGCEWKDVVAARIKQRPTVLQRTQSLGERAARKQRELEIAAAIDAETSDRATRRDRWVEQTGKSEQTLYRRLQELGEKKSEN